MIVRAVAESLVCGAQSRLCRPRGTSWRRDVKVTYLLSAGAVPLAPCLDGVDLSEIGIFPRRGSTLSRHRCQLLMGAPKYDVRSRPAFPCYRRMESAAIVGRMYDCLTRDFGHENVFKDVDASRSGSISSNILIESCRSATPCLS